MIPVRISSKAARDIRAYRRWLCREAGSAIGEAYIDALIADLGKLGEFPERGRARPEVGLDVRSRVFRRNVVSLYAIRNGSVTVLSVYTRGQQLGAEKGPA